MTFSDLKFGPRTNGLAGISALVFFPNGYGASVIRGAGSYGEREGLYELAVLDGTATSFDLCYSTPVTDDVLGYLSEEEVTEALQAIEPLPGKETT